MRATHTEPSGMRGHTPTTERTWDSEVLGRRVMLANVPLLTDADLKALRLELQEASASIRDQIELNGQDADLDWIKRVKSKQRQTRLFVVACGEETEQRLAAMQLERSKLKTLRTLEDGKMKRHRSGKLNKVVRDLLTQELGAERAQEVFARAEVIVDALLAQQAAAEVQP